MLRQGHLAKPGKDGGSRLPPTGLELPVSRRDKRRKNGRPPAGFAVLRESREQGLDRRRAADASQSRGRRRRRAGIGIDQQSSERGYRPDLAPLAQRLDDPGADRPAGLGQGLDQGAAGLRPR